MHFRWGRILAAILVLALLSGLALVTANAHRESRRQLEERFELRNSLAASFSSSYVRSVAGEEKRQALSSLAGPSVSERQFRGVVEALGFQAAVLLDRQGRLLRVWPAKPEILGTPIGAEYAHLRAALRGQVGVSDVVPSAARGTPIIAFAVPFRSAGKRRVFSGAFAVGDTPLAAYLNTALPFGGSELALVDGRGSLVLSNDLEARSVSKLEELDADLAAALSGETRGDYKRAGESRFFASHPVSGTGWQLVASVPTGQLYAPIAGFKSVIPWLLLGAFAVAALLAGYLLWRLTARRIELASANRRLEEANDELRDLDRLKDEFLALVSHELRTPLTSIIGYVSALQRGRAGVVPAEQQELLDVVGRNAQRLVRLIGDLLLAAKADAGKLELEPVRLELDAIVRHAVTSAGPHAEADGVELKLTSSGLGPMFGDHARLMQVLDNLISNAIKFTPAGGVVEVSLTSGHAEAAIEVRDTGIGIPLAEQAHLFQRFFRASTATSREIQGTGLGLSIAKTIVELHGGTIDYTSDEGAGTTFTIALPLATADEVAA